MAAWVAGDGEGIVDMFGADGTFEGWLVGPEQIPALHDWFAAAGWVFRDDRGRLSSGSGRVDCGYTMEDDLLRALVIVQETSTRALSDQGKHCLDWRSGRGEPMASNTPQAVSPGYETSLMHRPPWMLGCLRRRATVSGVSPGDISTKSGRVSRSEPFRITEDSAAARSESALCGRTAEAP